MESVHGAFAQPMGPHHGHGGQHGVPPGVRHESLELSGHNFRVARPLARGAEVRPHVESPGSVDNMVIRDTLAATQGD